MPLLLHQPPPFSSSTDSLSYLSHFFTRSDFAILQSRLSFAYQVTSPDLEFFFFSGARSPFLELSEVVIRHLASISELGLRNPEPSRDKMALESRTLRDVHYDDLPHPDPRAFRDAPRPDTVHFQSLTGILPTTFANPAATGTSADLASRRPDPHASAHAARETCRSGPKPGILHYRKNYIYIASRPYG